jgi:glycosyltransferase involved in cell wall biosynthesis
MVEIKNPLLLIETAEKLFPVENFHFLMVGDGGLLEKCRERTLALGMAPKFTFTGHRQDVPDLMQAMNIFTLTSNNEGMGRSILEAQSAGLPVIATQVGGVPEIIRDNLTGLLIPPGDPAALACAIEKLYRDRQLGNRLAASARQQLPLYSLEKTIANLDHIYQELLKAKRIASL